MLDLRRKYVVNAVAPNPVVLKRRLATGHCAHGEIASSGSIDKAFDEKWAHEIVVRFLVTSGDWHYLSSIYGYGK